MSVFYSLKKTVTTKISGVELVSEDIVLNTQLRASRGQQITLNNLHLLNLQFLFADG